MPKNLFKLSNLNNVEYWRKSKETTKTLEDRFDPKSEVEEWRKLCANIFGIIGCESWSNKVNKGMESIQNAMCQHILDLDNTIDVVKVISDDILKENFAPKGTVGKISREQAREKCKRDVARLKAEIKKEIDRNLNKTINKKKEAKTNQERTKRTK